MDHIFNYYEEVIINSNAFEPNSKEKSSGKKLGVVLGMAPDELGDWHYTLLVQGETACWMFCENELISTGKTYSRDEIYNGNSINEILGGKFRGPEKMSGTD